MFSVQAVSFGAILLLLARFRPFEVDRPILPSRHLNHAASSSSQTSQSIDVVIVVIIALGSSSTTLSATRGFSAGSSSAVPLRQTVIVIVICEQIIITIIGEQVVYVIVPFSFCLRFVIDHTSDKQIIMLPVIVGDAHAKHVNIVRKDSFSGRYMACVLV